MLGANTKTRITNEWGKIGLGIKTETVQNHASHKDVVTRDSLNLPCPESKKNIRKTTKPSKLVS